MRMSDAWQFPIQLRVVQLNKYIIIDCNSINGMFRIIYIYFPSHLSYFPFTVHIENPQSTAPDREALPLPPTHSRHT